jgi:hypothetical protein
MCKRAGVVYVDGIPIESTLLDAGESGLKGEERSDPTALALLDPRQVRRATTAFLTGPFISLELTTSRFI